MAWAFTIADHIGAICIDEANGATPVEQRLEPHVHRGDGLALEHRC